MYAGLWLLRCGARLPWRLLRAVGSLLGLIVYAVSAERRRITQINLQLCFPQWSAPQRRRVARQCFRFSGQAITELAAIWFGPLSRIAASGEITGVDHIHAAQAQGRGVLLVGFHTNDLELGATALAPQISKIAGMYRPHSNVVFDRAMRQGRERHFPMVARDDSRAALRWLKNGGVLWYAPDQDYGPTQSVFAPFFNHPAATINATTRLAKLANAVVIPMTHFRTAKGIRVQVHAPLPIPGDNDVADATALNQFLENYLRQHPANYMWMHRRFKTQAQGQPSLYPERATDEKRLSARRFEQYLKNGVAVATQTRADYCVQISPTRVVLLFARPWWQWHSAALQQTRQQLLLWQRQAWPTAFVLKQNRCSARGMDALHLELPPGRPLRQSDLAIDAQQAMLRDWQARYGPHNLSLQQFWLTDSGQLLLIP